MTTTLKVPGMMCQHCEKSVKGALKGIPGVSGASVNLETKDVRVEHGEGVTVDSMKAALEEIGYDVEGV